MATPSRRAEPGVYPATYDAYVLGVEPVLLEDGNWAYRAEYPQLPGVEAVGATALEAIDAADRERDAYLRRLASRGERAPRGWPRRHVLPKRTPR
jgi:predicted RNase H-like HicB family nuclease